MIRDILDLQIQTRTLKFVETVLEFSFTKITMKTEFIKFRI